MSTENVTTSNQGYSLSSDELSKLTEFFSLLIKIDKKNKKKEKQTGKYENDNKRSTNYTH